jgi:hypothetical protein
MSNAPDLSDPAIVKHLLLLGFSYSLTPDGSAGSYNERIALSIRADLHKAHKAGTLPWTGIQWEIYDAIGKHDEWDSFKAAKLIPKSHVAAPPKFEASEIKDSAGFANLLKSGSTKAARQLHDQLEKLGGNLDDPTLDATELASYLNRLLDDRNSFRHYEGNLELHDLHRIQLGAIGTEKRTLPQSGAYPNGLREFQARRVNRLIVESICPDDSILKRGEYLSTKGVLDLLLPQVEQDGFEVKYILVYGHPQHSPRCRCQTIRSLEARGWTLPEFNVYDVHEGQDWPWDSTTAQVWCRSLKNWQDYERMGKKRLSQKNAS